MKNTLSLTFLITLLTLACSSERDYVKEAVELYEKEDFSEARASVEEGIKNSGPTDQLVSIHYKVLLALEEYEDALETFEIILERKGEAPDIAIDKVRLLNLLGRHQEALEYAIRIDENSTEKSLYISSFICKIYTQLDQTEEAMEWLTVSYDRGDHSFEYYLQDTFQSLHSDPEFVEMIQKMKIETGIGLPVKDFVIPVVSGGKYVLSDDQGKVVLIDFWATWCPPCVAEFPNLEVIYNEFRDEGFEIISISLDSDRAILTDFLSKRKIPWEIGFSGKGMEDEIAKLFRVDSAPNYVLIDRQGLVQYSSALGGDKLNSAIQSLMVK